MKISNAFEISEPRKSQQILKSIVEIRSKQANIAWKKSILKNVINLLISYMLYAFYMQNKREALQVKRFENIQNHSYFIGQSKSRSNIGKTEESN